MIIITNNVIFLFSFTVDKLLDLWNSASLRAGARSRKLEAMLTDSQQFHELTDELCNWLGKMEQTLDSYAPVGNEVNALQFQLESQKVNMLDRSGGWKWFREADFVKHSFAPIKWNL